MNVSLAAQLLSASVTEIIREAIVDDDVVLPLCNKNMYHHIADLCEKWNEVVDICNGKNGDHTPQNAIAYQTTLLDILAWFHQWRDLHEKLVADGKADKFNFFADET